VLASTELCAQLEERHPDVKAIDPAHGAGLETVIRVAGRESQRRSQSPGHVSRKFQ
jgi:hypothetical protein